MIEKDDPRNDDPRKDDPRLTEYVLGELDPSECNDLEARIGADPELASVIAEIESTVAKIGQAYQAEPALQLSEEQRQEVFDSRSSLPAKDPIRNSGSWRLSKIQKLCAIVAGLLILVSGTLYIAQRPQFAVTMSSAKVDENLAKESPSDELLIESLPQGKFSQTDEQERLVQSNKAMKKGPAEDAYGLGIALDPSKQADGIDLKFDSKQGQIAGSGNIDRAQSLESLLSGEAESKSKALQQQLITAAPKLAQSPSPSSQFRMPDVSIVEESFGEKSEGIAESDARLGFPGTGQEGMVVPKPGGAAGGIAMPMRKQSAIQQPFADNSAQLGASIDSIDSRRSSRGGAVGGGGFGGGGGGLGSARGGRAGMGGMPADDGLATKDRFERSSGLNRSRGVQVQPSDVGESAQKLALDLDSDLPGAEPSYWYLDKDEADKSGQRGRQGLNQLESRLEESDSEEEPERSKSRAEFGDEKDESNLSKLRRAKSWQRVKALPNASRLMVDDGKDELDLKGMQVNVKIAGFRARVLIDCFYYNDRNRPLEGTFKLRLPDDASLYYFAFGESVYQYNPQKDWAKNEFAESSVQYVSFSPESIRESRRDDWRTCKEARLVPRQKAAYAYNQTMRKKVDPALMEWSGAGVFNARVFPLAQSKMHRIVIGYDIDLAETEDHWTYQLELPKQSGESVIDLHVQQTDDKKVTAVPAAKKPLKWETDSASFQTYRWQNPKTKSITIHVDRVKDLMLAHEDKNLGNYWGMPVYADLPKDLAAANPHALFLLDTSTSSNPDKFNVWLKLLRATLDNNRESLTQFNVLFFDVGCSFWKQGYVANTEENVAALLKDCEQISLEGATDLSAAIRLLGQTEWVSKNAEPDLFLLSDGNMTWGETDLRVIGNEVNKLGDSCCLYAYQTGHNGTAIRNLRYLANSRGGAVFSVANEQEVETASTAHRLKPWKLVGSSMNGATDLLTAGRVEWAYPGQRLMFVGRGIPTGDLELAFQQGNEKRELKISPRKIASEFATRLYGQVAVGQLESLGNLTSEFAIAYARQFRITGESCSLLMLETEQDYQRFDIKPEDDLFVVRSKNAEALIKDSQGKISEGLSNSKSRLMAFVNGLQSMPGMEFKLPVPLKMVIDDIDFSVPVEPLNTVFGNKEKLSAEYLQALTEAEIDYDVIAAEAKRRETKSVDEAIKVFSTLVEKDPGNYVIARDVAFSAMEYDRPLQAYPLLLKVAKARPYDASVYPALANCLAAANRSDLALLFFEIALAADFDNRGDDFKKIVAADYLRLLKKIKSKEPDSKLSEFAVAREDSLKGLLGFDSADLLIMLQWNTDQTDVDLHVVEPTGEECSYENKRTRIGGQITNDITTGFGPEMYWLPDAQAGKYSIDVKLFANDQMRTSLRNKVYLKVLKNYGKPDENVTTKTFLLNKVGERQKIKSVGID